ncbi:RDD family protein [Streptomyces sp. NPDC088337]|uniref:RDD family protein n=1 Tax=unclassified Streptomyces TaxID=2593676 RepID=UPI002DD7E056|nr:RDD family protein [Streptomyces sp. NBC_01788]WSB26968.1 RDD family protein [Streptomyces sp. NBC_01788]
MSTEPPPGSGQRPPSPGGRRPPHGDGAWGGGQGEGKSGGGPYYGDPSAGMPPPPGEQPPPPGEQPPPGGGPYGGGQQRGGGPYGPQGGGYGDGPYGGGPQGGGYGGGPYGGDPLAGMPPLADSGKRTLARIIDLVLVGIVVTLVTWGLRVNEYAVNSGNVQVGKSVAQSAVGLVLYMAYDTFMISRYGQTLGKKWLGMRVANLDDGSTPSVPTALARAAVLWIPFWFCCACLWLAISGGWSFFDRPYKQGLHDKAAKTVVVSTG